MNTYIFLSMICVLFTCSLVSLVRASVDREQDTAVWKPAAARTGADIVHSTSWHKLIYR